MLNMRFKNRLRATYVSYCAITYRPICRSFGVNVSRYFWCRSRLKMSPVDRRIRWFICFELKMSNGQRLFETHWTRWFGHFFGADAGRLKPIEYNSYGIYNNDKHVISPLKHAWEFTVGVGCRSFRNNDGYFSNWNWKHLTFYFFLRVSQHQKNCLINHLPIHNKCGIVGFAVLQHCYNSHSPPKQWT